MVTLIAPVDLSLARLERVRHVVETELVGRDGRQLVAPAPREPRGGGELGFPFAGAVAERAEQRDLLHHQRLQVERPRRSERAQDDDAAASADRPYARRRQCRPYRRRSRSPHRDGAPWPTRRASPSASTVTPSCSAAACWCGCRAVIATDPARARATSAAQSPIIPPPSTSTVVSAATLGQPDATEADGQRFGEGRGDGVDAVGNRRKVDRRRVDEVGEPAIAAEADAVAASPAQVGPPASCRSRTAHSTRWARPRSARPATRPVRRSPCRRSRGRAQFRSDVAAARARSGDQSRRCRTLRPSAAPSRRRAAAAPRRRCRAHPRSTSRGARIEGR